jgi:hypothetical protein
VQIDRDIEPLAPRASSEPDIIDQPSSTPAALRDDDVIEMWVAANDWSR